MIKAILLDFNGVIIDDEPIQMRAYRDILVDEGIDLTEEKYLACLGMNDTVFLSTIFERDGKTVSEERLVELIDAKTAKWKENIANETPIFEGVADFIKRMANNFALGVVSMARRVEIDHVLEKTGLMDSFSIVVSAEDVSTVKPDPECYREGFRLVDFSRTLNGKAPLTHKQCVVIEDSPPGILAGKKAGLMALGVTDTVDAKMLRAAGADAVTNSLEDWSPDSFRRVFV